MTRVYNSSREHNSVTVLKLPSSIVIGHRKTNVDGYNALILGFEKVNPKYLKKPQKEFFSKIKQEPLKKVKEFRVSEENFVEKGKRIIEKLDRNFFGKRISIGHPPGAIIIILITSRKVFLGFRITWIRLDLSRFRFLRITLVKIMIFPTIAEFRNFEFRVVSGI